MKKLIYLLVFLLVLTGTAISTFAENTNSDKTPDAQNQVENNTQNSETEKTEPEQISFELLSDDADIAIVNGTNVKAKFVNLLFNNLLERYAQNGNEISNENKQEIYNLAKDSLIQKTLMLQKAAELKLNQLSDEEQKNVEQEAQSMFDSIVNSYANDLGLNDKTSEEEKAKLLEEATKKAEENQIFFEDIKTVLQENAILNKLYENITKDNTISDEEINTKYNELVQADKDNFSQNTSAYELANMQGYITWYTPSGYRGIKHILLSVDEALLKEYLDTAAKVEENSKEHKEEDNTNEQTAALSADLETAKNKILESTKETTDKIYSELKNGKTFDELIEEYGKDPGMKVEPYKSEGYKLSENSISFDPDFTKAALALEKKGDTSEPIVSLHGVHILYYNSDIDEGPTSLNDDLKQLIKNQLLKEKNEESINNTIKDLLDKAKIERK